jgi:hypothetical protein
MTPRHPYGLGDGARLRRDRSTIADAQRRFRATADGDEILAKRPHPDPPPQAGEGKEDARAGQGKHGTPHQRWRGRPPGEVELSLLTHQARALYEGRVVPVRALAALCGVSLRTLYYHVHKQGWRRRRSSAPRDLAKSERQRERYRQRKAKEPAAPRGLKARDPDGQALALVGAGRAAALSGAALSWALMRQDAEAQARMLGLLTQALRTLAAVEAGGGRKRKRPSARPPAPPRPVGDRPSAREIERRVALLRRDRDARQAAIAEAAARKMR